MEARERSAHGDVIQDFDIGALLGQGGFSNVNVATSKISLQQVALKKTTRHDLSLPRNKHKAARLDNEIFIHGQVMDPFIVEFCNWFDDDKYRYIVMELCEQDLETFVRRKPLHNSRHPLLNTQRIKSLFHQIVRGVHYLHGQEIVHRDIKPKNILLKDDGETAKLCDFGLAIRLDPSSPTYSREFCGTPAYVPPEMFGTDCLVSKSFDIWSLGALLYFMATSEPLVDSSRVSGDLLESRRYLLERDFSFNNVHDWGMRELIKKMLTKDYWKRPTIQEVLNDPFFEPSQRPVESNTSADSGHGSLNRSNLSFNSSNMSSSSNYSSRSGLTSTYSSSPGRNLNLPTINESTASLEARISAREGKSVSVTGEVVQPLNTGDLRPQRLNYRDLVVCHILKSHEVVVEFLVKRSKPLKVQEFIRISPDGKSISHYTPKQSVEVRLSEKDPDVSCFDVREFHFSDLPTRVHEQKRSEDLRKYRIAAQYVEAALRRTAKHWMCTDIAQVKLMSNKPPNVETMFYHTGIKIIHSAELIEIKKGRDLLHTNKLPPEKDYREEWKYHEQCRERLLEQERMTNEANRRFGELVVHAMGCGRRPEVSRQSPKKPPNSKSYSGTSR